MFFLGAALFGGMVLLPLYWQQIRLESALDTGLLIAPLGLGMALVMPLAGRLTDRFGGGPLAFIGVIVTTLATIPFGFIGAHTSIVWLSLAMTVRGMGVGLAFMPAMSAAFAALRPSELADATPQLNVLQRVGGSIGTAVLAVVLQRALDGAHGLGEQASAYGTAFWWSTALTGARDHPGARPRAGRAPARARHRCSPARRSRSRGGRRVTVVQSSAREEALARVGVAFKGVMAAVRRLRGRDTHRPGELSFAQYHLLFGLAEHELSAGELAQVAGLAPATVTQMLDSLVASGLVERNRSERDRRIVTCSLTGLGRELIAERREQMEGGWNAALAEFSARDLSIAAAVLDRLSSMFDDLDGQAASRL